METNELFIPKVLANRRCVKHGAEYDQPCWWIPLDGRGYSFAICDERARRAGFNNKIDPRSLQIGRKPR